MTCRLSRAGLVAWTFLIAVLPLGCGGREFGSQGEAVAHFRAHRSQFERVAQLLLISKIVSLNVPSVPSANVESDLVRLSRDLRVRNVARVPGVETEEEQWIEFRLAQRPLQSSYGFLYVPDGHEPALKMIAFLARSPTHGIRVIRPIEGRWFYYDYD